MTTLRNLLIGAALFASVHPSAAAPQDFTGTIVKLDRINRILIIRDDNSEPNAAARELKAQAGTDLDAVHAGDKVTVSTTETGEVNRIKK